LGDLEKVEKSSKIQFESTQKIIFFAKSTFFHAGKREKKSFFHAVITFFHAAASSVKKSDSSVKKTENDLSVINREINDVSG
jgi:hypothetical protein